MIFRPRRKDADTLLICEKCGDREAFPSSTEFKSIADWARRQGWRITWRGGQLYDHHCPTCVRLSKAPQAYWDRLSA